jgi:hypothetical protein
MAQKGSFVSRPLSGHGCDCWDRSGSEVDSSWGGWREQPRVDTTRKGARSDMRPRDGIDHESGRCLREIAEGPRGGPDPPILDRTQA